MIVSDCAVIMTENQLSSQSSLYRDDCDDSNFSVDLIVTMMIGRNQTEKTSQKYCIIAYRLDIKYSYIRSPHICTFLLASTVACRCEQERSPQYPPRILRASLCLIAFSSAARRGTYRVTTRCR